MSTKTKLNQAGFGHTVLVFVLLFVAAAGFAGYKVLSGQGTKNAASTVSTSTKFPAKISAKADLVQASKALDNSSTQVDSSLNDGGLDADLNDLL
jgi:hypothetical protein